MISLWLVMVAIAQALAWMSESPKSLAAAATREAIRRQVVGPSVGFYNNDTLIIEGDDIARQSALGPGTADDVRLRSGRRSSRREVDPLRCATDRGPEEDDPYGKHGS